MKSKSSKNVFNVNDIFYEEVDEAELKRQEFKKKNNQTILIRIIVILSLGLFAFSVYYAFIRDTGYTKIETFTAGDLFLVHSSADFGPTINSFLYHRSEDTSHKYSFYVENEHDVPITYKLNLNEEKVIGKNIIDKKTLQYSIIKNDEKIATGLLSEIKQDVLLETKINSKSKDYFILKLWTTHPSNSYFKYKIKIS